ncbi:MAG: response regulator transcription factor [Actinomycetota bacterium]|nr:response regulator transcription factor [Actinomycetota bacterium]
MTDPSKKGEAVNLKVLVVDDTEHVRDMLVQMLELDGFDVVGQASSGGEAIDLAKSSDPNVIVMDFVMPDLDGLSAAKAIKKDRPTQAIILYTAYLDANVENQAREAGVALVVGKVEGLNQLERHINELCRDFNRT